LFQPLFPRFPEYEVPIGHVTNVVHVPTWDGEEADRLWTELCGKGRWREEPGSLEGDMRRARDQQIWHLRSIGRTALVEYARRQDQRRLVAVGRQLGPAADPGLSMLAAQCGTSNSG